jgi:hypothetical protein
MAKHIQLQNPPKCTKFWIFIFFKPSGNPGKGDQIGTWIFSACPEKTASGSLTGLTRPPAGMRLRKKKLT